MKENEVNHSLKEKMVEENVPSAPSKVVQGQEDG